MTQYAKWRALLGQRDKLVPRWNGGRMAAALLMVANASAGSADVEAVRLARTELERSADVDYRETANQSELDAVIRELSGRVLVVAGGDGSLHTAVNALNRSGTLGSTTVGLIPLGTGNDMARTTDIPFDPVEAARVVLTGEPSPLAVLVEDDRSVVINAVHVGIGAEAVRLGAAVKKWLGPAGYPVGAVMAGVTTAETAMIAATASTTKSSSATGGDMTRMVTVMSRPSRWPISSAISRPAAK